MKESEGDDREKWGSGLLSTSARSQSLTAMLLSLSTHFKILLSAFSTFSIYLKGQAIKSHDLEE